MSYKTIQLPLVCIIILCGGGVKKMMCLDLYYYLGIKITIFLRPSSSFKFTIPFGGGGALQIFGSISLFVQVDRNLVFLWGNL